MAHFDMLQMADKYREIRHSPPLLVHFGQVSTMVKGDDPLGSNNKTAYLARQAIRKLNRLKGQNPEIISIETNMTQWSNYSIDGTYHPSIETGEVVNKTDVFWGKFLSGDVVDVRLKKIAANIR